MLPYRVQRPGPRSCRNSLRGPGQTRSLRNDYGVGSEAVLGADLRAPWVAYYATRFPEVGVRSAKACVIATEVLVVEHVEQVERHRDSRSANLREVLAEPQVEAAIPPRSE